MDSGQYLVATGSTPPLIASPVLVLLDSREPLHATCHWQFPYSSATHNLAPGMRVLDMGCGPGRMTIPAAMKVGPEGQVVALDIQAAMLERVKKRTQVHGLTNIQTIKSEIGHDILEHNYFDRALLVTVLGEITNREAALSEIYAALKPEGILSITETLPDPHYQSQDTVRCLAEAVGFRLDHHYGNWLTFTMNFVKPRNFHY